MSEVCKNADGIYSRAVTLVNNYLILREDQIMKEFLHAHRNTNAVVG
jgi:hypothetical protein